MSSALLAANFAFRGKDQKEKEKEPPKAKAPVRKTSAAKPVQRTQSPKQVKQSPKNTNSVYDPPKRQAPPPSRPQLLLDLSSDPNDPKKKSMSALAAISASTPVSATPKEPEARKSSNGSVAGDYFSIPRDRCSVNSTTPQETLEAVRNSINSKAKLGVAKESQKRTQEAVNEFRTSIENKRWFTNLESSPAIQQGSSSLSPLDDAAYSIRLRSSMRLYPNMSRTPLASLNPYEFYNNANESLGSLGSSLSGTGPIQERNNSDVSRAPSIKVTDSDPDETLTKPPPVTPIKVPLSPHARAREEAVHGESLQATTIPEIPDAEEPKRARRKPPPDLNSSEDNASQIESLDLIPPGRLLSSMDESDTSKFPVFPQIEEKKHKRRGFFGRKKETNPASGYQTSDSELYTAPSPEIPQGPKTPPPPAPAVANPYVSLKTTMRKWDKRKDKKTSFNTDKPWKNHLALDAVSDIERKRYEGLFASNKGLYVTKIVHRLNGVDYSGPRAGSGPSGDEKSIDALEKAAKLSAESLNQGSLEDHLRERHGLNNVDPHDLIVGPVVRRIWGRSKLPRETLEQIWDLVDFRKDGTLNKVEFIVGMWLVDQCLYGRKLPRKVEESVWASLGSIGVNVTVKKKR